jgi:hypothetical protein
MPNHVDQLRILVALRACRNGASEALKRSLSDSQSFTDGLPTLAIRAAKMLNPVSTAAVMVKPITVHSYPGESVWTASRPVRRPPTPTIASRLEIPVAQTVPFACTVLSEALSDAETASAASQHLLQRRGH